MIRLCALGLFAAVSAGFASAAAENIEAEAEAGRALLAPARVLEAGGASGGQGVRISGTDAADLIRDPTREALAGPLGSVEVPFAVPRAGTYSLWVRLQWHCTCSRMLAFKTSAKDFRQAQGSGGQNESVLTSYGMPRVWHWVLAGEADFEAGEQWVSFEQRGHLAWVDAISLSTEAGYSPPGYAGAIRSFNRLDPAPAWEGESGGRCYQALGDEEWDSFLATATLQIPSAPPASGAAVGLEFCCRRDGGGYEILLERPSAGMVKAGLWRAGDDGQRVAIQEKEVPAAEPAHSLGILKTAERIAVLLDGHPLFEAVDDMFPSGTMRVVGVGVPSVLFEDAMIRGIHVYREIFQRDVKPWTAICGSWKVASNEAGAETEGNVIGTASPHGLLLSPWSLGDNHCFRSQVKPLEGASGIAFDAFGPDDFRAVLLDDGDRSGTPSLRLVECKDGVVQDLWAHPMPGGPDQWHTLELRIDLDCLRLYVDGHFTHGFRRVQERLGGGVGLCVVAGGTGGFAGIEAYDHAPATVQRFFFEPEADSWSLSHWRRQAGQFVTAPHPGRLLATPGPDQAVALELRQPLGPEFEIKLAIARPVTVGKAADSSAEEEAPGLSLPVLPDDPRAGLRIQGEDPADSYEVALDLIGMRELRLLRNGDSVGRAKSVESKRRPEVELYCRASGGRLEAGIVGDDRATIRCDIPDGAPSPRTLLLFGENLPSCPPLTITQIEVSELYPALGSGETANLR